MRTFLQMVLSPVAGLHGIAMNFSAQKASRKWPCEGFGRTFTAMVTVATVLLMLCAQTEPAAARKHGHSLWGDLFGETRPKLGETRPKPRRQAALPALPASVPLPQPRPADAPAIEPDASPPPPSACRLALTEAIAIAPSIPDIKGPGDCGGEDLVRLEAVVLPDKRRVSLKPAATFRCPMATAVADWIRTDMAPLAASLGSVISDLDHFDSVDFLGRNCVHCAQR